MTETKLMCLTHGESGSSHPEMVGECWFKTYTRLIPKAYPEWERVENGECRMVERVLSVPGELIDPAVVDYEAAAKAMYDNDDCYPEQWETQTKDVKAWYHQMTRYAVRAALGHEEPEGSK